MIHSMTGYATRTQTTPHGTLNLELRAVNNRYLDILLRLPDDFRPMEPVIRENITQQLNRGKIECRLSFTPLASTDNPQQLNTGLLQKLQDLDRCVKSSLPEAQSLSVADILNWPGILGSSNVPIADLRENVMSLLLETLQEFQAARAREGEKLKAVLLERVAQMRQQLAHDIPTHPQPDCRL